MTVLRSAPDVLLTVVLTGVPPDTVGQAAAGTVAGSAQAEVQVVEGDLWVSCRVPASTGNGAA